MSYTFTVETGVADPDSNAYCTVDFASDWIGANPYQATAWEALTLEAQQNLLIRASLIIDKRVLWNGRRLDPESGMRWPRCGVYDEDGFLIPDDTIPVQLQQATAEFASYLMNDDWTSPQGQQGFREIKVDVIDLKVDTTYIRPALPDTVRTMLINLGSIDDGMRPAFKRIVRC